MASRPEQLERGRKRIQEIFGEFAPEIRAGFEDIAPDFFEYADEYVFGGLWCREGIDLKTRIQIVIGALTVLGLDFTLGHHIRAALVNGLTKQEIIETIMAVAPYGGHPRAIGAFRVAKAAFTEWDARHPDQARSNAS
ncbi:MAG: carboxymuconolactone decarboxylase family protein [Chloroflexota bacterium]|nr:carboxymuconolactone decarboxylase family protein [Dehalococcoidia bacterium]MDW8253060.1 carboxymuconolactone decarboxylase family protein [Chloroflexota bacterium]